MGASMDMTATFFKGISAIVCVFAKDDEESFKDVNSLLEKAFDEADDCENIISIVVGNKSDVKDGIADDVLEQTLDKTLHDKYLSVSARDGQGVQELF